MRIHYINNLPPEWEPVARIFAALGDATRQTIMLLFEPEEIVGLKQIADALPLSRTAVVHHISVLEQANLLTSHKRGREVYYTLERKNLIDALDKVRLYAEKDLEKSFPEKKHTEISEND